jgi:hypothetical protein
MGWTGRSWLFTALLGDSTTRLPASILLVVATTAFVISGIGIFIRAEWWWPMLLGSALFSAVTLLLFWDGSMELIVQKGLIGFFISLVALLILLLSKRTIFAF